MPLTVTTDTFKTLLFRGLLAGLIAGLLAGAVAFTLGEPHVQAAIEIEEAAGAADVAPHGHDADSAPTASAPTAESEAHSHGDDALVSRTGQRFGLFLATGFAGLALGAIVAVVVHYARRFTTLPGPLLAASVAGSGWLAVEAVPFFKYPANPPAVGDPDTIDERTLLWLATVALGLVAVAAAVYVGRRLLGQGLVSVRVIGRVAAFLAIVAIGYLALPTINEVGDDFPATLLWEFRVSSLATQATLWLALGLMFALLTERAHRPVNR
ncbi:CbtA family protein [Prescottella subtropica]|uniref:CbtA family protein n=1 Tax=Prescottella subtropica TaxID=2545757 RepID=UPI0010F570AF|nr:CbtA family protein [Prescottella subtropica]